MRRLSLSSGALALILIALPPVVTPALAYRPFVSTDAAVAEPKEVEIELGYFNLERTRRETTITTPSMVLNFGLTKKWEVVGEFRVEQSPDFEITDPGLFVAWKGAVARLRSQCSGLACPEGRLP